ncbi:hypothetical protein NKI82_05525 [Mesorhizobium sp. M0482]|uniref:hypothetical protein n=1 Tax=Mesorhizobium sp. M0482 TaxID=2956948 RepID=UPI003337FB5F
MQFKRVSAVLAGCLALVAGPVLADNPAPPAAAWVTMGNANFYNASLRALVILFVMAILIESALAVIFNWRLFLELFYGRGVKTLVMIAVSALVVWTFNIDVVHTMLASYQLSDPSAGSDTLSRFLTALILAGGSSGVYQILVSLGYRQARTPEDIKPKPKNEKAWISVKVLRRSALGPVYVRISDAGAVTQDSPPQLAGVIAPTGFWSIVWSVFFLDRNRFPQAGGFEVDTAKQYKLDVSAKDSEGQVLEADINGLYTFGPGAIIDMRTTL